MKEGEEGSAGVSRWALGTLLRVSKIAPHCPEPEGIRGVKGRGPGFSSEVGGWTWTEVGRGGNSESRTFFHHHF